jgi:hypothetical protein
VRFVDEMDRISAVGRESLSQMTSNSAQNLDRSMRLNRGVPPQRLIETMEDSVELPGVAAQLNYLSQLQEIDNRELKAIKLALVGAGIGTENLDTNKLRVLNYKQAMKSEDVSEWKKEIEAELERFEKYKVFKPVPRRDLPDGEKVLTTTWAFKHKANGSRRGRLNARGYEQLKGEHFMADSVSSPVTNPATIRILILLLCMNPAWVCKVEDVEGAFLQGTFENGEVIYCEVPDGMEEFYGTRASTVLLMQVPLYGTKQASKQMLLSKACRKEPRQRLPKVYDGQLAFLYSEKRSAVSVCFLGR